MEDKREYSAIEIEETKNKCLIVVKGIEDDIDAVHAMVEKLKKAISEAKTIDDLKELDNIAIAEISKTRYLDLKG